MRLLALFLMLLCILAEPALAQRKCGRVHPTPDRVGIFTAGELAGHRLGDLYAAYIGVGEIGEKVTVDPGRQLDSLWLVKEACYRTALVVHELHEELLSSYRAKRSAMTLGEFVTVADREIGRAQDDMDWKKFQSLYHLIPQRAFTYTVLLSSTFSNSSFATA